MRSHIIGNLMAKNRPKLQDSGAPAPRRRTRARAEGDDRSPLDCCVWCLRWIRSEADRRVVPLLLAGAPVAGELLAEIVIDDHPMFGIVPQPGSWYAENGAHLVVIVCGPSCEEALQQGLSHDAARARGESPPRREPTERERAKAERLLGRACAWCMSLVKRNAPVICIYATLKGERDVGERSTGIISLTIGGRLVPGRLVEAGSAAALTGGDIGFLLCGDACASELSAAIALEASLSVVH